MQPFELQIPDKPRRASLWTGYSPPTPSPLSSVARSSAPNTSADAVLSPLQTYITRHDHHESRVMRLCLESNSGQHHGERGYCSEPNGHTPGSSSSLGSIPDCNQGQDNLPTHENWNGLNGLRDSSLLRGGSLAAASQTAVTTNGTMPIRASHETLEETQPDSYSQMFSASGDSSAQRFESLDRELQNNGFQELEGHEELKEHLNRTRYVGRRK